MCIHITIQNQHSKSSETQSKITMQQNWKHVEIVLLIKMKRDEFFMNLELVDIHDPFEIIIKW